MSTKIKRGLALLMAAFIVILGIPFTSYAVEVSTPNLSGVVGTATGATTGNFTWNYDLPAPYVFQSASATLNSTSQPINIEGQSLSLTGLDPNTNYDLSITANYSKSVFNTFAVTQETKTTTSVEEKTDYMVGIFSKVDGSWLTNPRYYYTVKNGDTRYNDHQSAIVALYAGKNVTYISPFTLNDFSLSGWRGETVPVVIYSNTITTTSTVYKIPGSNVEYSTYDAAKAAIVAGFNGTSFDSTNVTEDSAFTGNVRNVYITGINNYQMTASGSFKTKAFSTLTVVFHSEHSTHSDIIKKFNDTSVASPTPTHTDFNFLGWYLEETLTTPFTNSVTFDQDFDSNTILDVYAKWVAKTPSTFTINFDTKGGNTIESVKLNSPTTDFTMPADPEKDGFNFLGWVDAQNQPINFENLVSYASLYEGTYSVTLYADWEAKLPSTFTINFDTKGGNSIESVTLNSPTTDFTMPADPEKDGFNFLGWVDAQNQPINFENLVSYASLYEGTYSVTLYADWEAKTPSIFTINFNSNGGTIVSPITLTHPNSEFNLPTQPTRTGYTFAGWFYDNDGTETAFGTNFEVYYSGEFETEDSINVIAKWNLNPPVVPPTTEAPVATTEAPVATTEAPTELITDEEVAEGDAGIFDFDSFSDGSLEETTAAEEVEIETEATPLADALPQTGQLPVELFYGIGGLITAAGVFLKKKN